MYYINKTIYRTTAKEIVLPCDELSYSLKKVVGEIHKLENELKIQSAHRSKSALIFGATGLVGSCLLQLLLADSRYDKVIVAGRRKVNIEHKKLEQYEIDLFNDKQLVSVINADEIYCCLGTTSKKAGSREMYKKIDLDLPLSIAIIAKHKEIKKLSIVSSVGASSNSLIFYLKTKGSMEKAVADIGIEKLHFAQPSFLGGKREKFRFPESLNEVFLFPFASLFIGELKKYKPILAKIVAAAMIQSFWEDDSPPMLLEYSWLMRLANKYLKNKE